MRGDEIIDVDVDPQETRRARWRRLARFGIPLAGVVLIVGAIIAITLYSYRSNRDDALALSQDLIAVLDQRVRAEVESYLEPAAQAVRTLAGMLPDEGLSSAGRPLLEELAMELLRDRPQLASLYCRRSARQFPHGAALAGAGRSTPSSSSRTASGARSPGTGATRRGTSRPSRRTPPIPSTPAPVPGIEGASAADGLYLDRRLRVLH